MMKKESETLINELLNQISQILVDAKKLNQLSNEELTKRPNSNSWNVLECIEHMNQYGDYYLHELEKQISNAKYPSEATYKSSWLGNYAANSMLPKKSGAVNFPMKTFPKMDPIGKSLSNDVLDKFISQMESMQLLLEKARTVSLTKTKCKLTIKWLKFNLGDTFRFMVNHNYRHMLQVFRILETNS